MASSSEHLSYASHLLDLAKYQILAARSEDPKVKVASELVTQASSQLHLPIIDATREDPIPNLTPFEDVADEVAQDD